MRYLVVHMNVHTKYLCTYTRTTTTAVHFGNSRHPSIQPRTGCGGVDVKCVGPDCPPCLVNPQPRSRLHFFQGPLDAHARCLLSP